MRWDVVDSVMNPKMNKVLHKVRGRLRTGRAAAKAVEPYSVSRSHRLPLGPFSERAKDTVELNSSTAIRPAQALIMASGVGIALSFRALPSVGIANA